MGEGGFDGMEGGDGGDEMIGALGIAGVSAGGGVADSSSAGGNISSSACSKLSTEGGGSDGVVGKITFLEDKTFLNVGKTYSYALLLSESPTNVAF